MRSRSASIAPRSSSVMTGSLPGCVGMLIMQTVLRSTGRVISLFEREDEDTDSMLSGSTSAGSVHIGVSERSGYGEADVRTAARWMVERVRAARDAGCLLYTSDAADE